MTVSKTLLAEALLQRDERLARVHGAHVGEVEQHAQQRQIRVEAVARQLDDLHRLLDALQREVLRLGGDQRMVGGDERVDRQQAQRRRAVDQDHVVVVAEPRQRASQRQLAAHLAAEHQLRLGEAEVGGDDVLVDRLGGRRAAGEHVGDRRLDVGGQVEVVGEVALRVEVDCQRAQARCGAARRSSVRTVVVLPVPPFCESTAIVWAIGAILRARAPRRACSGALSRRMQRSRRRERRSRPARARGVATLRKRSR